MTKIPHLWYWCNKKTKIIAPACYFITNNLSGMNSAFLNRDFQECRKVIRRCSGSGIIHYSAIISKVLFSTIRSFTEDCRKVFNADCAVFCPPVFKIMPSKQKKYGRFLMDQLFIQ